MDLIDKYLGEGKTDWKDFYKLAKDRSGKTFKEFEKKYSSRKFQMPHIKDALDKSKDFKQFMDMIKKFNEDLSEGVKSASWGKGFGPDAGISIQIHKDGGVYAEAKRSMNKREIGPIKIADKKNQAVFHLLTLEYTPDKLKKIFSKEDIKAADHARKLIQKQLQ